MKITLRIHYLNGKRNLCKPTYFNKIKISLKCVLCVVHNVSKSNFIENKNKNQFRIILFLIYQSRRELSDEPCFKFLEQ
jgi:hypothetical protein